MCFEYFLPGCLATGKGPCVCVDPGDKNVENFIFACLMSERRSSPCMHGTGNSYWEIDCASEGEVGEKLYSQFEQRVWFLAIYTVQKPEFSSRYVAQDRSLSGKDRISLQLR